MAINISAQNKKKLTRIFQKYQIISAYLFGSEARGTAHLKSDVDMAVRFSKKMTLQKELMFANELRIIFSKEIDIVDLDSAPLILKFRIYRERTLLYARDRKKECLLQARDLSVYFDYKYYLDRFVKFETDRILAKGFL